MAEMESIRKKIEEQKTETTEKNQEKKEELDISSIDMEKVDKIVERMKKKYSEQGVEFEEASGRLRELRSIIAEGTAGDLEIQSVEELKEAKTPLTKMLGIIFLRFRRLLEPLQKKIAASKRMEQLGYYIYAANMKFSAKQYIAISMGASALAFFVGIAWSLVFFATAKLPLALMFLMGTIFPFALAGVVFIIAILIPKSRAKKRGDDTSVELPFALRQMSTELRAGIGLYRTIQAIALAGYGPLSEEFARAVTEIEEGTDAKDALRHLALTTQSKALVNAIVHLIRAMETGGNLSEIMNEIAEDVSFDLRLKVRDFSQKMNFFGVIFIFTAIVLPVIITILGIIRNSPISVDTVAFRHLPLSVENITLTFTIIIPLILLILISYIKAIQPRV